MNESKAFRAKRAADNVLSLAREWSKAHRKWQAFDGDGETEDRLYEEQKLLHLRLENSAHELVAVEAET